MTDREASSKPEKTLRKRKVTKHPWLCLPACASVCLCVHVGAGFMPLDSPKVASFFFFFLGACITRCRVQSVTFSERLTSSLECDTI